MTKVIKRIKICTVLHFFKHFFLHKWPQFKRQWQLHLHASWSITIFFKLFFDTFDFYHHRLTTGAATVGSSAWEGTVGCGPPWRMRGVVPSSRTGSMRTRSLGWPFWHVPQPCRSCASESPSTSSRGSTKWRNSSKSRFCETYTPKKRIAQFFYSIEVLK